MLYWKLLCQVFVVGTVSLSLGCGGGSDKASMPKATLSTVSSSTSSVAQNATNFTSSSSSSSIALNIAASDGVAINGRITFDRVPFEGRTYRGLDYNNIQTSPARGITVQALNGQNTILASDITDGDGHYTLDVAKNTHVRIRVKALLTSQGTSQWSIHVKDNTNGNAAYVLDGSLVNSGVEKVQTRDLHAPSGWVGDSYTDPRSAAPFAILDSIYDALRLVDDASPGAVLPPLTVYWSSNNIAINGNTGQGNIGTSYYTSHGPSIYLLGAANNDSDEYDRAVIQHEFGHYLEHQLGRTESLGGSHNQSSRLDMRVAFGEAWGNAFAGMASGDPIYRDSFGASQSLAFAINVERRGFGNQGWFSESTIQAILYDLFDDTDDGGDPLAFGFKPIFDALTSDDYLAFAGFASIYPFVDTLRKQQPQLQDEITAFVNGFNIYGSDGFGSGESNDGGSGVVLPLYHQLDVNDTVNLCSDSDYQDYNGMDVRRFVRLQLANSRAYTFTAVKSDGGLVQTNPQMRVFTQGSEVASMLSGARNSEQGEVYLTAGSYILEVYEEANVDGNADNSGLACFDISLR